jgi:hypothetical protein
MALPADAVEAILARQRGARSTARPGWRRLCHLRLGLTRHLREGLRHPDPRCFQGDKPTILS